MHALSYQLHGVDLLIGLACAFALWATIMLAAWWNV